MIVEMNEEDRAMALEYALERNKPKRQAGVMDRIVDASKGSLDVDYMGLLAEMAVAKTLKVPLMQLRDDLSGDPGYDLVWHDRKVQVKYTFHRTGHLLLVPPGRLNHPLLADLYVLVVGSEKEMDIVGYARALECKDLASVIDFGFGETLAIKQQDLHDFSDLLKGGE